MSGTVTERKRLLRITAGNIRQSHIYINGHHDFFPSDSFVMNDETNDGNEGKIEIYLTGLNKTIFTEICIDPNTGKPQHIFRGRSWVKRFFQHHKIKTGDILAIEKIGDYKYRLYPFESKSNRAFDWQTFLDISPEENKPTVLELFAGCGGMVIGFKNAGFQTVLANEWDAAACETIKRNLTDRVAQCAIQEIDRFPNADVVVGGPPCQGFSNLGERMPSDPRRQLWRQFMRAVSESSPTVFVIENVPPILASQEFVEIKQIAEELGYTIEGKILNSADYGVPQTRKRAIIIGCKGFKPSFPEPTHYCPDKYDLFNASLKPWITVRDAIGDLSFVPDDFNFNMFLCRN